MNLRCNEWQQRVDAETLRDLSGTLNLIERNAKCLGRLEALAEQVGADGLDGDIARLRADVETSKASVRQLVEYAFRAQRKGRAV